MRQLSIALTGDIYPVDDITDRLPDVAECYDILRDADLAIGNFEIPVSKRGNPVEKLLNIRADPDQVVGISRLGLDVATVANNHSMDYGWDALADTMGMLRENGIETIGAGENLDQAVKSAILERDGRRVGVLACSCLLPTGVGAASDRAGISPLHIETSYEIDPYLQLEEPGDVAAVRVRTWTREDDLERIAAAVADLKQKTEIVVVTLHWGFGSGETLAEYQYPLACSLIDAGADIVHGHHPHAIHPIGFYRDKPIFFSMNVFVGQQMFLDASARVKAMWAAMSNDAYVARVDVSENGAIAVEIVPIVMNKRRLPERAKGKERERIVKNWLERLSEPYGGQVCLDGDRILVAPR